MTATWWANARGGPPPPPPSARGCAAAVDLRLQAMSSASKAAIAGRINLFRRALGSGARPGAWTSCSMAVAFGGRGNRGGLGWASPMAQDRTIGGLPGRPGRGSGNSGRAYSSRPGGAEKPPRPDGRAPVVTKEQIAGRSPRSEECPDKLPDDRTRVRAGTRGLCPPARRWCSSKNTHIPAHRH